MHTRARWRTEMRARAKAAVDMLNGQRRYGRGCACMYVCSPMYLCMHDLKQVRIYVIVCACMYVGVRRWCTPDMRDMSVRIAQS